LAFRKLLRQLSVNVGTVTSSVGRRENLPELTLAITRHLEEVLGQPDGFLFRAGFEDRESADHFLRFHKWSVSDAYLSARGTNARAERARQRALSRNQPARFPPLFNKPLHRRHIFGGRGSPGLGALVNRQESHRCLLSSRAFLTLPA